MSEPLYCPVRRHYCSCHDWGDRCDVFDDEQMPTLEMPVTIKADYIHRASQLVSLHRELGHAVKKMLSGEVGETVRLKIERWEFSRELATIGIPPTYLARAIKEYRDSVQLEAEALGVVFDGEAQ